jgi:hypothetical protein
VSREQIDDLALENLLLLWLDASALDLLHDVVVVQARDLGKTKKKMDEAAVTGGSGAPDCGTAGKERTWPAAASRLQFQLDMYTSWKSMFSLSTVGISCRRVDEIVTPMTHTHRTHRTHHTRTHTAPHTPKAQYLGSKVEPGSGGLLSREADEDVSVVGAREEVHHEVVHLPRLTAAQPIVDQLLRRR